MSSILDELRCQVYRGLLVFGILNSGQFARCNGAARTQPGFYGELAAVPSTIQQAVLLAAGTGTRLMPLTEDRPKCMVEVGGRAIVDTILDALAVLGVSEVVVVTGHQAEVLEQHLRSRGGFRYQFVHNERFRTTNNILSLHVARHLVRAPFALVESDIYMSPDLLTPLARPDSMLVAPYTPTMDGTGVVMDAQNSVKEMVIRAHLHRSGELAGMHKTVNFYSFSEETYQVYQQRLDEWVQAERLDEYYEAVLAELINEGTIEMRGVDIGPEGWAEVDDAQDLAALEARLAAR